MHCYNSTCKYIYQAGPLDSKGEPTDIGLHMPENRPYIAFCSTECHALYNGSDTPERPASYKLTISEIQDKLHAMARAAGGTLFKGEEDHEKN